MNRAPNKGLFEIISDFGLFQMANFINMYQYIEIEMGNNKLQIFLKYPMAYDQD